jgi:hypothetical protein
VIYLAKVKRNKVKETRLRERWGEIRADCWRNPAGEVGNSSAHAEKTGKLWRQPRVISFRRFSRPSIVVVVVDVSIFVTIVLAICYDVIWLFELSAIYVNAVSGQNIASLGKNSDRMEGSSR